MARRPSELGRDQAPAPARHRRRVTRPTVAVALLAQGAMACAADTPLGSAVGRGDISAVRAQLAAGHDANAALTEGWTPLTVAASAGNVPLIILLVQAGADVNRPKDSWLNQDGRSPLHWAASSGNANVVRTLIEFGAAIDHRAVDGDTALWWAAANGRAEVVSALRSAGADWSIPRADGLTPRAVARRNGHTAVVALLDAAALK